MDGCCHADDLAALALRKEHRRVLVIVLAVNASLFLVELGAGLAAHSTALLGDSLDMLGDALVYGFSLYVLTRSERLRVSAAILKGGIMAAFGLFVLAEATQKMVSLIVPTAHTMTLFGLIALSGNGFCFWLLYRHRADDLNMRSTWLCSRNDLVANVSVLAAAVAVAETGSAWPDVIVGVALATLFLRTAVSVLRDAATELRTLRERGHGVPTR